MARASASSPAVISGEPLVIRDCTLRDGRHADVVVRDGKIAAILAGGSGISARSMDAAGGLLIPGLHDHHLHLAATAAAATSVRCGPPDVVDRDGLIHALTGPGEGWIRGIGYHESVAGFPDRHQLDAIMRDRPLRIQHRSGRMWMFNSRGIELLLAADAEAGQRLEAGAGGMTGRLIDQDAWLSNALRGTWPAFSAIGTALARAGVCGITDMTVSNDHAATAHFAAERARGALPQKAMIAGRMNLGEHLPAGITRGPFKIHLHDAALPDYGEMVGMIAVAHAADRPVAVHCVTQAELVFTLAAIRDAGALPGDRIEHASIAPPDLVGQIADLKLAVVTQPNFIAERGDAYLDALAPHDRDHLYRLRSWLAADVALAGGTDSPFGAADPWRAMAAAVSRRTASGGVIGAAEALTPEQALDLFLADPADLSRVREVVAGAPADLCLLTQPWAGVREALDGATVALTLIEGRIAHDDIDQPDRQRFARADPSS